MRRSGAVDRQETQAQQSVAALEHGRRILAETGEFAPAALESAFRQAAEAMHMPVGSFFAPFRVAITGKTVSPPLFESMEVLGREEVVARVDNAARALAAYAGQTA